MSNEFNVNKVYLVTEILNVSKIRKLRSIVHR